MKNGWNINTYEIPAEVRRAKAEYFKSKVNEVKISSAYWRLVKDATNISKYHKPIGPLKRDNGSLAVCDAEKANMMNAYFSSIGATLAAKLPVLQTKADTDSDPTGTPILDAIRIQESTVKNKISNLKTNKATGPDDISPRLIRLLGETVVPPLTSLFNLSFKTGVVFQEWKTAKLTTVHKKDDETDRGNYRPLSILSVPSKILESCVNDAIVDHVLNSNRLVTDNQWAYRKGYSTELLLVHLTETWRDAIDSGLVVGAAFIDFKKAFDCVDHDILLNKPQCQFGIRGPLLNWLTSYLTSRLQYTVLNGQRSRFSSVSSGVPQGSVLGPTLFVLYTSNLVESVQSGTVHMYADDTTIYCIGKSIDEVAAALNQSLTELYAWCVRNKLTPHPKKSECMLIHRGPFTGPHPPIYLGDNILERVTYSRLLGVDIDDKLNWSVHIKGLKKSFVNKLSLMKKSRFLPKQDLLNLYFKVIIPAVTYGISVWGGTNRSDDFDSLESLHCRAARVIFNFPKDLPSVEALTRAKWDTLRTYYKHSILKLIYKMYFNDSPPCMTAHIAKSQPSYNLRNSLKLEIPKFKSNIKKSSVSYRGTILWNLLSSGCRMAGSVNNFSKIIKNLTLVKDINFANIYCRR